MSDYYVHSPSQESDLLKYMHRPDLYQWADKNDIDYPMDAPAHIMRTLIRSSGKLPTVNEFDLDSRGNPSKFKRLPRSQAPKSKHEERVRAAAVRQRDEEWERHMAMDVNDLRKKVKDQHGAKAIEENPSKEWMITKIVGPRIRAVSEKEMLPESKTSAGVPDHVLDILTPVQLVKLAKQNGIEANVKDGKQELLRKIRANG